MFEKLSLHHWSIRRENIKKKGHFFFSKLFPSMGCEGFLGNASFNSAVVVVVVVAVSVLGQWDLTCQVWRCFILQSSTRNKHFAQKKKGAPEWIRRTCWRKNCEITRNSKNVTDRTEWSGSLYFEYVVLFYLYFSKIIDLKDNSDDQWILCSYGKFINSNLITAAIEALL